MLYMEISPSLLILPHARTTTYIRYKATMMKESMDSEDENVALGRPVILGAILLKQSA